MDFLATVAAYPKPDEKLTSTSSKVQGGGSAANALTCASRLGLNARLISKSILEELQADGVDTSFMVVSKGGTSPFTYVIVDEQTKTCTGILTRGYPPMIPDDLSRSSLLSALDGARTVYSDVRFIETALVVAQEASCRNIPILVDAIHKSEWLGDLLTLADYVVCSTKFLQAWTEAPSIPSALISMLLRLPNIKFAVVTLGEEGCIMLERSVNEDHQTEEIDIDSLLELLTQKTDDSRTFPTFVSSSMGGLIVGTAEKIPPSELLDTTGAGDAFIGAVLYAICTNMPAEKMLPFAAQVAAGCCRGFGARTGLPYHTDPRLISFLS